MLISLLDQNEWDNTLDIYEGIIESIENIKNPDVLTHLKTILTKINFPESKMVSTGDLANLITQLINIPVNEKDLLAKVYDVTVNSLPTIKFNDEDVSNKLAFFIREIAPFAKQMQECCDKLREQIEVIKNLELQDIPMLQQIEPYKNNIIASLERFMGNCLNEIHTLIDLLERVQNESKGKPISEVLNQIQKIIHVMSDPLKDFTVGNFLLDGIVKSIAQPFVSKAKDYVIEAISTHLLGTLKAQISESVNDLHINDDVLNQPNEAEIKLSSRLNDFLISRLPAFTGKELALEINVSFQRFEEMEPFIKCLKDYKNKAVRDGLIAVMYRRNYFKLSDTIFSLNNLTEILTYLNSCQTINRSQVLDTLFVARENGVDITLIMFVIPTLTKNEKLFSVDQISKLLQIGLNSSDGYNRIQLLIAMQNNLKKISNPVCTQAFSIILARSENMDMGLLAELHNALREFTHDDDLALIAALIVRSEHDLNQVGLLMQGLKTLPQELAIAALGILNASLWQRANEKPVDVNTQVNLIKTLVELDDGLSLLHLYETLYQNNPCPGFNTLHELVKQESFDSLALHKWIQSYELDPFGHLSKVKSQFNVLGAETFISEIRELMDDKNIHSDKQKELMNGFAYIMAITDQYCMPIPPNDTMKPLMECSRKELKAFYMNCIRRFEQNPDPKIQYEALAALCVCMFRSTGKFSYHTQIISVLNTLVFENSILQEIPTGQGKSITNALIAAMSHSFGIEGADVCVGSRNKFLAQRDFEESRDFYEYMDIPVALVMASTEKNYYEDANKPTIKYTTAADISLYESRLRLIDKIDIPPREKRIYVGDEFDAECFDNKSAFNFSTGTDDPYVNPLEWIYPLVNQFIDSGEFKNEHIWEDEDIFLFRQFVENKNPEQYKIFDKKLTDYKLGQLLDSACAASPMKDQIDFVIRQITREVHGKEQIISEAHILDPFLMKN